jgi:hypothetical protein
VDARGARERTSSADDEDNDAQRGGAERGALGEAVPTRRVHWLLAREGVGRELFVLAAHLEGGRLQSD